MRYRGFGNGRTMTKFSPQIGDSQAQSLVVPRLDSILLLGVRLLDDRPRGAIAHSLPCANSSGVQTGLTDQNICAKLELTIESTQRVRAPHGSTRVRSLG
jgi:hypothetical protein